MDEYPQYQQTPPVPPTPPYPIYPKYDDGPRHNMRWLVMQALIVAAVAFLLALIMNAVDGLAASRVRQGLLNESPRELIGDSLSYCFAVIAIPCYALMLIEIAFRKYINVLQYILIGMALALFYLLLTAMAEQFYFWAAYTIVSVMTIGLISLFVKGITHNMKAVWMITGILAGVYAILYILINLGSLALLIGSLLLFALIGVAMYFTLKLKLENDELVIK